MTEQPDYRQLADQLRCPSGERAPEVARRMNGSNGELNRQCIDRLELAANQRVLEIGPGNAAFAGAIVDAAAGITYTGLDWSGDMVQQARAGNAEAVARGAMDFRQGDAARLPFDAGSFDRALSVHTLYFWEQPLGPLAEIRRVLRPGGLFCLAFGDRDFMEDLPFTGFGFRLYRRADVQALLDDSDFQRVDWLLHRETGQGNAGDSVDKIVNIALARV